MHTGIAGFAFVIAFEEIVGNLIDGELGEVLAEEIEVDFMEIGEPDEGCFAAFFEG